MWCGPDAVARLTGWTRNDVWLHLRYVREQEGKPLPNVPHGGTYFSELKSAVERAGYELIPAWYGVRRMRYRDFVREHGKSGRWFCRQAHHFFARCPGDPVTHPNAIILQAWCVKKQEPFS